MDIEHNYIKFTMEILDDTDPGNAKSMFIIAITLVSIPAILIVKLYRFTKGIYVHLRSRRL